MSDDLARLHRWEEAGGTWQVDQAGDGWVAISLLRCDGGEEIDRFTTRDERVLAYVDSR